MKNNQYFKGFGLGMLCCFSMCLLLLLVMNFFGMAKFNISFSGAGGQESLRQKVSRKVNTLEAYIDRYFLEEIDEEKMADSIYKGVIAGLDDDYAAYYTAEEYKDIMEKTNGVYCGIGAYISVDSETGVVSILKPMKNSPAEKAGVKAGDIIYAVDDREVTGMEISQVQALVKGEQYSKVVLTLLRNNEEKKITVVRDEIEDETVASQMLDNKIGYVQVTGFEQVTPEQFSDAIDSLEKQDEKGLIIDLRDNGGGLLDSAVDMLDTMLPEGLVVYSMDKDGQRQEYMAEEPDAFEKPVVILVNKNSASASEVFSGAMQDRKAAVLMGSQTFGKGIVQSVFDLRDGSALKMTTAKYYTPEGRDIHGKGLTPDIEVEYTKQKEKLPETGIQVDNQIKAAVDYLTEQTE